MRIALVNLNKVVNIIEADIVPSDMFGYQTALESDTASIGDTLINGVFVAPVVEYTDPNELTQPVFIPPNEISSFQAKAALVAAGLYTQVQAYISTLPMIDQLRWQEATTFRRDNEYLVVIANGLGLSEQEVDDLFELGRTFVL